MIPSHVAPFPSKDIQSKLFSTVSKDPIVSCEERYYRERIKHISTIDEFIKDKRLFSYALKAFGLSDMSHAEKFIKKILESDLSDPKSLVNQLNSLKYQYFARSYDFSPPPKVIQSDIQHKTIIQDYKQSHQHKEEVALEESKYFRKNIHKINSVDQLFKDRRLLDYVLQSFSITPKYISLPFLKDVLTLGLANPKKYFIESRDNRFRAMAENFRFQPDGSLSKRDKILTDMQIEKIVSNYFNNTIDCVPIVSDQNYYKLAINSVSSFSDFLKDPKLFKMLQLSLFPLNPEITADKFLTLMQENDPIVSQVKYFFQINFHRDNSSSTKIQQDSQIQKMLDLYKKNCQILHDDKMQSLIKDYQLPLGKIKSIDNLLSGKCQLEGPNSAEEPIITLQFALDAYNLNMQDLDRDQLRNVLTSNPSDPDSYANKSKDDRLIKLNHAFNFNADGSIGPIPMMQSRLTIRDNVKHYANRKRSIHDAENKSFNSMEQISTQKRINLEINSEVDYYTLNINTIHSFEELLANKRILNFLLESKGIDSQKVREDFLCEIFKSDLKDPKSFANTYKDNRYKEIISSFNFDIHGELSHKKIGKVQDNFHIDDTCDLYKHQMIEKKEEEKDPNIALALYFKRTIPNIRNHYEILGDSKLFKVVSKKLKLSPYFAVLPERKKIRILKKHIKINDFKDSKKVEDFLYAAKAMDHQSIDYKKALFSSPNQNKDPWNNSFDDPQNNVSLQLSPQKKSNGRFSILNLF
ncbi:DUF1217 domain-containing protein [Candidatus Liberibacter asiaticus]|uniref:Uncharacterized protein n=4 Tax=Liberibacter asiaticus TaxID=34021 RepID=C6XGH9_LIBAP|nr:DUF1217 domain-containing protein [Candidatus Liberibacter asiaticus]ACT57482.1 hypothetical protein CLIBASIA_04555 [Candidatus Liberibacter asiaticus str. psy62]AGH17248.1 hypothetical protein WSI_04390 [Candidatus Liberibacter asiaticus str. gxpsy]ALK07542.1 DUF1217 domain-containing protein [Candidatus Liberibacter asiaticus]ASK53035.1 hypothetical protein B2I23_04530 [Candidatus Liberibacter asiaticus]AWL14359.1 DUF1217 domain-containing protein [Candidatus Liberibacter asiaticus]